MTETLTDAEVRHLAISMLRAESARDRQRSIGASDLSNPCDCCLAWSFTGAHRVSQFADRPYLGRVWGSAGHGWLERPDAMAVERALYPDAKAEQAVVCCEIPGYGQVPGHYDNRPVNGHIIDWKGSERKKLFPLIDYWTVFNGGEAPYGRSHANVKLSQRDYEQKMLDMALKITGYYGQAQLYLRGSGPEAIRASIVFICRDGTGFNDNPEYNKYEDPKAVHDVWVLSFNRDDAYTDALIQRGAEIWARLEAGAQPHEFDSQEHCFICKQDAKQSREGVDLEFDSLPTAA